MKNYWELTLANILPMSVFPQLDPLATDGLLTYDQDKIEVLPAGRLLIRNICMAFDFHLQKKN
ncbi:MAG: hypothetical protein MUQ51_05335 [Pseudomonadota bacterium]|nr:hypothetical protein [Pseudomonadota bacterium]MDO7667236.1 hypothetical protein [Pseudomonadota bacterium]MDO7711027.1 hypothetical protein [Pseudomonadota bacterium]